MTGVVHKSTKIKIHYRCRRSGNIPATSESRKRRSKKKGYIGTKCRARHELIAEADGSFLAVFRGFHNHDCQTQHLLHVNPIQSCFGLRDQIDRKLHSGATRPGDILDSVRQDAREKLEQLNHRGCFQTHEDARSAYMVVALTADMVKNRRRQLGLVDPHITSKDDATSVLNLVNIWKQDKGASSPVVYYKRRGIANSDTSEQKDSLFTKNDFLLVGVWEEISGRSLVHGRRYLGSLR